MRTLRLAASLMLLAGCSTLRPTAETYHPYSPAAPAGVVFVANGAGDFHTLSANLNRVLEETAAPLQIETVGWSIGYRRYVADQVDCDNHIVRGRELACRVAAYRQAYPGRRIDLIGHSAGCAVLLVAAESLPPNWVDRIILLSPSVCRSHDLRPALRCSRCGIDVFSSSQDWLVLGLGVGIVGTTDPGCWVAAGDYGFTPVITCSADAALYCKLRQHAWDPAVEWTGHDGGHFGNNQPGFLRAYVLPLLLGP